MLQLELQLLQLELYQKLHFKLLTALLELPWLFLNQEWLLMESALYWDVLREHEEELKLEKT